MAIRWTATALHARLEALEGKHQGEELIAAVVAFADTLVDDDRKTLQQVLLERADRQRTRAAWAWLDGARRQTFPPPGGRRRPPS